MGARAEMSSCLKQYGGQFQRDGHELVAYDGKNSSRSAHCERRGLGAVRRACGEKGENHP